MSDICAKYNWSDQSIITKVDYQLSFDQLIH